MQIVKFTFGPKHEEIAINLDTVRAVMPAPLYAGKCQIVFTADHAVTVDQPYETVMEAIGRVLSEQRPRA